MESWQPNLEDDNEPRATLTTAQGEFLAHRGNTTLFTHLGRLALYDHVFCQNEEDKGFYIFKFVDGYDKLSEYLMENSYPAHVNLVSVADCDIDAYDRAIKNSVEDLDYVPDDWQ